MDAEAQAAEAEHRVNSCGPRRARARARAARPALGDLELARFVVRQELVERRIEGPNRHGPPCHRPKMPSKSSRWSGSSLASAARRSRSWRRDGLASGRFAFAEEHVLGPAEADALGAEGDRVGALVGLVGVGADAEPARLVGPLHELRVHLVNGRVPGVERAIDEDAHHLARRGRDLPGEDLARRSVKG